MADASAVTKNPQTLAIIGVPADWVITKVVER